MNHISGALATLIFTATQELKKQWGVTLQANILFIKVHAIVSLNFPSTQCMLVQTLPLLLLQIPLWFQIKPMIT